MTESNLVSTGVPTAGLGISMMVEGFKKDKVSGNIPGGVFEVSGMVVDKAVNKGDASKPAWGRLVGEWTDFGAGMKAGGLPTKLLDIYTAAGIAGYNTGDISNTVNAAVKSDEDKKNRGQNNVKVGNGVKAPDPAKSNMVTNGSQFIHFGL
ncbi:hypothetical protein [Chitinophaga sp. LS1]|uniref:hypothetical protein n=1 Tax=Chitinophaga sp. LS1 TaxID=3051176 RepID=UPI002AAB03D2|nr:hypothetical protein [Chitinophaga sp. LS1]WPV67569.1 hypothetical protein QQL36_02375 [Chitinophaga sp. LS1]